MTDMVQFKHGTWSTLPEAVENGTIYIAKAADGKAYMYMDKDGEKLNITSPNTNFYGVCSTTRDTNEKVVSIPGFLLTEGALVTINFSDGLNLTDTLTLNINSLGGRPIYYRGVLGSNKGLAKNTIQDFLYDGTTFHLVGDINEVNNGITISPSNDTNYHPLLIAAAQGPKTLDAEATKSMLAVTNPEKEITATLNIGRLNAPGGFYAHDGSATTGNEVRATFNSSGIDFNGNFESGLYSNWTIYPNANGDLVFNGVGDLGDAYMRIDLENDTLYANAASIA